MPLTCYQASSPRLRGGPVVSVHRRETTSTSRLQHAFRPADLSSVPANPTSRCPPCPATATPLSRFLPSFHLSLPVLQPLVTEQLSSLFSSFALSLPPSSLPSLSHVISELARCSSLCTRLLSRSTASPRSSHMVASGRGIVRHIHDERPKAVVLPVGPGGLFQPSGEVPLLTCPLCTPLLRAAPHPPSSPTLRCPPPPRSLPEMVIPLPPPPIPG